MANTKISDFTSGAPAQSGDEFVIARSGANFKLAGSDIKTLAVGAGSVSVASTKTLTASNTLTLAGTDSTTMTFPATSGTVATLNTAQTFTAKQTIDLSGEQLALGGTNTGVMSLAGSTSGKVTIQAANAAGTYTLTLPTNDGDAGQFLKTDGSGVLSWDAAGGGGTPGGSDTQIQYNNSGSFAGASGLTTNGTNLTLGSSSQLLWSTDLILTRRGAANLRFGAADAAAPVAQTLSVQSVVAGTTNTAGANLTITGSQGTGTGTGGSIIFQVAPAGSSGTAQNALSTALTIAGDRSVTIPGAVTFFSGTSGHSTITIPTGNIGGGFNSAISAGANNFVLQAGGIDALFTSGLVITLRSTTTFGFAATADPKTTAPDTIIVRDAANTLAQRNGANAQAFNIYNTFTSSTNFERFRIFAQSAAAVLIGTEKGSGGGTARALELQTDATSRLALDTVGSAQIVTALTVATLPGTPLTGMMARVTDALAPAVGVTVASGGAAQALCWYNGANWTVIGV